MSPWYRGGFPGVAGAQAGRGEVNAVEKVKGESENGNGSVSDFLYVSEPTGSQVGHRSVYTVTKLNRFCLAIT